MADLTKPSMGRFEARKWQPAAGTYGGRRHRRPMTIQTWVPNEIAEWEAPVSGATLGIVTEADRSISELNRDAAEFAAIEALSRQLLRQESVASSRIEGLVMGQRRLARASFDTGGDETAKQIVGNIRAMERAIALGSEDRPFTYEDLIAIHTTLLEATRDAHLAGMVREEQNWVGGTGLSPADAEYIPPPSEYVEKLLRDLVEFVNRDDLPPSLQAAAAHAQFETIHPFLDGNGRVGRCLIHVVLRRGRAAKTVVPPISLVLATNADAYIAGLGAWRGESPSEWILFFAGVAITAAREARRLADMVGEMQGAWLDRAGNPRRDSSARKLIEQLPAEPIISINRAIELTGATRPAVDRAFAQLERAEILTRLGSSRRNRQWEARAIFDLLDEYERDLATPDGRKRPARPARADQPL
jgi:Fic family protein